ncbi:hypothetical protein CI102_14047 [Trichoderma harzianum]|nr:hypothetical protein CI102_14047 [Trichoderma harzianum]
MVGKQTLRYPVPMKRKAISIQRHTANRVTRQKTNYPKKRVSVACEVCRSRKTRCDAAQPTCSFCAQTGALCEYRSSQMPESSETHLVQDSDHDLFSRLDRIEGLLLEAKSHRSAATKSHLADQPYAPLDYQFPTLSSRLAENQLCGETENSDVVVFGFDLHCLSSFRTKEFHQALLPLRVNDFEESLEQELKEATTPGLDYFRAACQIVDGDRKSNYTLQHVQCHILMSVYFQSCLLPIQAFESIRVASEKIVLLLQMRKRIASDRSSCLLQSIHELVPLPTSDSEEPGFYGFLACIALCRIVARARNGISWNRVMLKEPVIVREIILQLSKWYATLPPPIKFPLLDLCQAGVFSNGTLLDTQQAQLRAKFFSTHALLHWPNVVLLLEIQSPTTRQADDQVNHDSSHILNGAAKALEFATMSIYAFESLYSNPNLLMESNGEVIFIIKRVSKAAIARSEEGYATALGLSVYNDPSLKMVQHLRTMEALCSGWHLLRNAENIELARELQNVLELDVPG